MTDLKLYKHFVQKIEPLGKIKRAWFTTFNLDIAFFEKYILSAVLGEKPENLRHPVHYESLSAQLASNEADLIPPKADQKTENNPEAKTEVKVFYDFRMLHGTREKLTTVELFPIESAKITIGDTRPFEHQSFHPKVILLENQSGEYWLMVSSANLTLSGWARNREAFFFEKLNTENFRRVGAFFKGFINPIYQNQFENNELYKGFESKRPNATKVPWYFASSFDGQPLTIHLKSNSEKSPLQIWSPYFDKDLDTLSNNHLRENFTSIEVIPAKNANGKIPILEKVIKNCTNISLHEDVLPPEAHDCFVHAKVWLTPEKLAIGSWNMTTEGMGIESKKNVEAGIVYYITEAQFEQIQQTYRTKPLGKAEFCTEEELNAPEDELPSEKFVLGMDAVLDWNKHQIQIEQPRINISWLKKYPKSKLLLPGFNGIYLENLKGPISLQDNYKVFLKDRSYSLISQRGKVMFRGYLREVGLASRPVNSFENLEDLFKGWVSEKPEARSELHVFGSDAFFNEVEKLQPTNTKAASSNAWFSTFYAFEAMEARLKEANKEKQKEVRMKALKQIGMVLPGSFKELRALLSKELSTYKADKKNYPTTMYLWFKIEKANVIFEKYNKSLGQREKDAQVALIKNFSFKESLGVNSKHDKYNQYHSWEKYVQEKLKSEA